MKAGRVTGEPVGGGGVLGDGMGTLGLPAVILRGSRFRG